MKRLLLSFLFFLQASIALAAPVRFTIVNKTAGTVTYNSQAITTGSSFTVGASQIAGFANDAQLRSDLNAESGVYLSDGVTEFSGQAAIDYLSKEQNRQVLLNDNLGNGITSTTVGSTQRLDVGLSSAGATGTTAPIRANLEGGMDLNGNMQAIAVDTSGNSTAVGNVGSGTADSGNPIKIGGKFNTTPPTLTNGQRGDAQLDEFGNVGVAYGTGSSFRHQAAAATVTLKTGVGRLLSVCLNTNVANNDTITLWDNTAASGTMIALIKTNGGSGAPACAQYNLYFSTGLTFTTSSTDDWTIVYQ